MTMNEYKTQMEQLAAQYGDILHQETPNANALAEIEAKLKKAKSDASAARAEEIISDSMRYTNPVVECARNAEYEYPSYKVERDQGVVTGISIVTAIGQVKATDLCKRLYEVSTLKTCPYERVGVVKNGHAWEYRSDKMAFLMAQKVAGGLEISAEKIDKLEKYYKMTVEAKKQDLGKDPFSNRQMVKTLQSVIDLLAFIPNEKGENVIKATTRDSRYIREIFARGGKAFGDVKTLKGRQMAQYIFAVVHMIVTGKAYTTNGDESEGDSGRNPIPVSALLGEKPASAPTEAQVEVPETVVVPRPTDESEDAA